MKPVTKSVVVTLSGVAVASGLILLAMASRQSGGGLAAAGRRLSTGTARDSEDTAGQSADSRPVGSTVHRPRNGAAARKLPRPVEGLAAVDSAAAVPPDDARVTAQAAPPSRAITTSRQSGTTEALDENLPVDTAPVDIQYATIEVTPQRAKDDEAVTFAVRLCCDSDLDSAVLGAEIDLEHREVPGRLVSVQTTAANGLESVQTPREANLVPGRYRAQGVTVTMGSGRSIYVPTARLRAGDPLLAVTGSTAPLSIERARILPADTTTAGPMPSLELAVADDFRGTATVYVMARNPKHSRPMQFVSPIVLPYGKLRLIEPRRAKSAAGTWQVESLAVELPDGRNALWDGAPLTFSISDDGSETTDPITMRQVRFEPDTVTAGETTSLIVEVAGGGEIDGESDMVISNLAQIKMTSGEAELVMIRRLGSGGPFLGKVTIPDTLSPGEIRVEKVSVSGFNGTSQTLSGADSDSPLLSARLIVR
ncbi:MAG: hypothetical protein HYV63_32940 [Candidatus Schekmanbacteria bacterium]|nr:hypothetical protein [Candidatus Schekmanbacteria bacterium]